MKFKMLQIQSSKYILIFIYLFIFNSLLAQHIYTGKRLIIGVVVDSLEQRVVSEATITYISKKDSLQGINSEFGFNIRNVPSSEFRLIIKSLGYKTRVLNFYYNHELGDINIPPINLQKSDIKIEEVLVSPKSPQLHGDTTSFWAENYNIRDYAVLKELIKQLEGVDIDNNGNLTYNGKVVTKALLNGHSYFQGSIKEALNEIPVSVINKVQFIDKKEDLSDGKLLQSEQTATVMNIVTKKDKSAAKMFNISLLGSTAKHKKIESYFRTIDKENNTSYNVGYEVTPLGIRPTKIPTVLFPNYFELDPSSLPSSGNETNWKALISKTIKSKKFSTDPFYQFNKIVSNQNTIEDRVSYYSSNDTLYENVNNETKENNTRHRLFGNLNTVNKNISIKYLIEHNTFESDKKDVMIRSGTTNGKEINTKTLRGYSFTYDINGSYNHSFSDKWNIKLDFKSELIFSKESGNDDLNLFTTKVSSDNSPDSVIKRTQHNSFNKYQNKASMFLTWNTQKNIIVQFKVAPYNISNIRDIKRYKEKFILDDTLSNYQKKIVNTVPIESLIEYTFYKNFYIAPLITVEPKNTIGYINDTDSKIERFDILLTPQITLGFKSPSIGLLRIGYSTSMTQPDIEQLNPTAYYISNFNIIIGNPLLENTKKQVINYSYNVYLKKLKVNIATNGAYSTSDNSIGFERSVIILPEKNIIRNTNRYINIDSGEKSINNSFLITKALPTIKSKIDMKTVFSHSIKPFLYENNINSRAITTKSFKIGLLSNFYPWLEFNPSFNYYIYEDKNGISSFEKKYFNSLINIESNFSLYIQKDLILNSQISFLNQDNTNKESVRNSYIINGSIEKRIFKKKNGSISISYMDFLKDNYISRFTSNEFGYVNTMVDKNSRYFLLQFAWKPQQWTKGK